MQGRQRTCCGQGLAFLQTLFHFVDRFKQRAGHAVGIAGKTIAHHERQIRDSAQHRAQAGGLVRVEYGAHQCFFQQCRARHLIGALGFIKPVTRWNNSLMNQTAHQRLQTGRHFPVVACWFATRQSGAQKPHGAISTFGVAPKPEEAIRHAAGKVIPGALQLHRLGPFVQKGGWLNRRIGGYPDILGASTALHGDQPVAFTSSHTPHATRHGDISVFGGNKGHAQCITFGYQPPFVPAGNRGQFNTLLSHIGMRLKT